MKTEQYNNHAAGILIALVLYSIGFKDVISREAIGGGKGGGIIYHLTGNSAIYLGYVLIIGSFIFLIAFCQDLRNHLNSNYVSFNFKPFIILLIIFAIITPVVLTVIYCTDLNEKIKIAILIFYLIYSVCFLRVMIYL